MLALVPASGICAYIGYHVRQNQEEKSAIEQLRSRGSGVVYSPSENGGDSELAEFFSGRRTRIQVRRSTSDPTQLALLADFRRLEELIVIGGDVRGKKLTPICGMTSLTIVNMQWCKVSSDTLECLSLLPNLDYRDLGFSTLDDDCMVHIGRMEKLTILLLTGTQISDEGAKHLFALTNLEGLDLRDTNVSDEMARKLAEKLSGTVVCDATGVAIKNPSRVE
jgi:hypothetical protein